MPLKSPRAGRSIRSFPPPPHSSSAMFAMRVTSGRAASAPVALRAPRRAAPVMMAGPPQRKGWRELAAENNLPEAMHDDPAHVDFAAHRSHSIAGQGGEPGQGAQQGGADEYGVRSSTLIEARNKNKKLSPYERRMRAAEQQARGAGA
eukprot:PRCOL_00001821-RA